MQPVITHHSPNSIEFMFWGLIPHWAQDTNQRFSTINARVEGIENKPAYRKPFRFQRCLVPATLFYEPDKSQKPSIPYLFQLKDKSLFAMAGLYDVWKDHKDGKEIYSYTIITTQANELVSRVHHPRMPVILKPEDEVDWLNPDIVEPELLLPFLQSYPADLMDSYRVSKAVWYAGEDSEDLIKPQEEDLTLF